MAVTDFTPLASKISEDTSEAYLSEADTG